MHIASPSHNVAQQSPKHAGSVDEHAAAHSLPGSANAFAGTTRTLTAVSTIPRHVNNHDASVSSRFMQISFHSTKFISRTIAGATLDPYLGSLRTGIS